MSRHTFAVAIIATSLAITPHATRSCGDGELIMRGAVMTVTAMAGGALTACVEGVRERCNYVLPVALTVMTPVLSFALANFGGAPCGDGNGRDILDREASFLGGAFLF